MTIDLPSRPLPVGVAVEHWASDARLYEYTAAADPIGAGVLSRVPLHHFDPVPPGPVATGIRELDLSRPLGTAVAATTPGLLASFVTIAPGDLIVTSAAATSQLFFVVRGAGRSNIGGDEVAWQAGDFFAVPSTGEIAHRADEGAVLYHVSDAPLLAYLGVLPVRPMFRVTHYRRHDVHALLSSVAAAPDAADRNRLSVLLANARLDSTLTVTHTLWAMFGLVPAGTVQRAHRHQSVAVDLVVDAAPGCYTLVGSAVDARTGDILDPQRVDWTPGGVFVTPPGLWHAHHNESGAPAHIVPVQDAGLHTYLRSLDIRFA